VKIGIKEHFLTLFFCLYLHLEQIRGIDTNARTL
jgi:hypothetical protein